jgi:hypothetical protein
MEQQNTLDWELLEDLTRLRDEELLRILFNVKSTAKELECRGGDSEKAAVDALLQWELADTLECEKRSRALPPCD